MASFSIKTLFGTELAANEAAACNTASALLEPPEERWSYTVVASGGFFAVEVRDEEGELLGTL